MFLEAYTSILLVGVRELEELYGVKVETADREMVESQSDEILKDAVDGDVALCVVGDPFGATTHSDLLLRARESGIDVCVIHNASIMNAIAACGLQLYKFGQVSSMEDLACILPSPRLHLCSLCMVLVPYARKPRGRPVVPVSDNCSVCCRLSQWCSSQKLGDRNHSTTRSLQTRSKSSILSAC